MKKIVSIVAFVLFFFILKTPAHAASYLSGDFNQDSIVDLSDYSLLVRNFLKRNVYCTKGWNIAEINDDCTVDLSDYSLFISNFLKSTTPTEKKTALVFINEDNYQAILPTLTDFKNDVEGKLPVMIKFLSINGLRNKTADEVRSILITECGTITAEDGCQNIEGAMFVGDVPFELFDQVNDDNHTAPFMFFYQDLDATFEKNSNGHYFKYATYGRHDGPEIYISWVKTIDPSLTSEIDQLRAYFEKHHRFFSGQVIPQQSAVVAIHCNIVNSGARSLFLPLIEKYGSQNTAEFSPVTGCDELSELKYPVLTALSQKPETAYIHSHGNEKIIWAFNSNDFRLLNAQPLFIETWGCRNGNWLNNEDSSTAIQFINGKDLGLAYFAKLDNSDIGSVSGVNGDELGIFINSQIHTFNYWTQGMYLGKAILTPQQQYKNYRNLNIEGSVSHNLYRESGPLQRVLIGSPFVYPQVSIFY